MGDRLDFIKYHNSFPCTSKTPVSTCVDAKKHQVHRPHPLAHAFSKDTCGVDVHVRTDQRACAHARYMKTKGCHFNSPLPLHTHWQHHEGTKWMRTLILVNVLLKLNLKLLLVLINFPQGYFLLLVASSCFAAPNYPKEAPSSPGISYEPVQHKKVTSL